MNHDDGTRAPATFRVPSGPVPMVHPETAEFWTRLRSGAFTVQRCRRCHTDRFPPAPACFRCLSVAFDWVETPGTGRVNVAVQVHRATGDPVWAGAVPFTAGLVDVGALRVPSRILCDCGAARTPGCPVDLCLLGGPDSAVVYAFAHDCARTTGPAA